VTPKTKPSNAPNADTSSKKTDLFIGGCSYEAAKFACEHYHDAKCSPVGSQARFGVWEDGEFVGAIVYGNVRGRLVPGMFKVKNEQIAELLRIALRPHKTEVSKMISITVKLLKKNVTGLKLIISYADRTGQGHVGGIYKASNFIHTKILNDDNVKIGNKLYHRRGLTSKMGNGWKKMKWEYVRGIKYRYVYPLCDDDIKPLLETMRQPYPSAP